MQLPLSFLLYTRVKIKFCLICIYTISCNGSEGLLRLEISLEHVLKALYTGNWKYSQEAIIISHVNTTEWFSM